MSKKWMTLNQHGKMCLMTFICAISASDILTTQVDYLIRKELIISVLEIKNIGDREEIASYCLTDLGVYTAAHYFPKFTNWQKKIERLGLTN